eukprot:3186901-Rhodomonas_salina.3
MTVSPPQKTNSIAATNDNIAAVNRGAPETRTLDEKVWREVWVWMMTACPLPSSVTVGRMPIIRLSKRRMASRVERGRRREKEE